MKIQDLYALYTRCFPAYPVSEAVFHERLKPEEGRLFRVQKDGQTVGFSLFRKDSLSLLCVERAYRRCGIGSELLRLTENAMAEVGYDRVLLGRGDTYLLQGVPCEEEGVSFFQKRGYTASWESVDMIRTLSDFDEAALALPPMPSEVFFRWAHAEDAEALDQAAMAVNPSWAALFRRLKEPILLAWEKERVVGFAVVSPMGGYYRLKAETEAAIGSIGCVGVVPDRREHGIGRRLVANALTRLRERGAWAAELRYVALVEWYERLGFSILHRQWMGEKKSIRGSSRA